MLRDFFGFSLLRIRKAGSLLFATAAAMALCCVQSAASVTSGTIIGVFSNPILAGQVAHDPTIGQSTFLDNTGTAAYTINNSNDPAVGGTPPQQLTGSALSWGVSAGNSGPNTFSVVTFFGNVIPGNISQPFQVGTITYSNGTSDLDSLIFGATLSFYDNVVTPSAYLGSDNLIITTTNNLGQSTAQDADYISICGNQSNICNNSIEAVEATEGGNGVTVNLFGVLSGDPMLDLTSVALAPGQSPTTNGFIGNDPPIGANAPEPNSAFLLLAGCLLAGFLTRTGLIGSGESVHQER